MTTSTTLPAPLADQYALDHSDRATSTRYGQALAYAWGVQDYAPAGTHVRDTFESGTFASVFALAGLLTDGYGNGPLQDAYATWIATGRLVVRIPGDSTRADVVASVHAEDRTGSTVVVARARPWTSDPYYLSHTWVRYARPSA